MSNVQLSAVIAVDDPAALGRTLDCVLQQECPFGQIVVCCPIERTSSLHHLSARVETFPVAPGLTPAQQWNEVAPHIRGEWISFFTSDDLPRSHFVREVEQTVKATPMAAILRAGWIGTRDNGRPGVTYTLHSVRAVVKPADALYEQRFGPKGSLSACAIRRQVWQSIGLFPEATPHLADWAMWLLAGASGDTVRSREVISEHRTRQLSTEDDAARKTAEIYEAYLIYRDILPRATTLAGLRDPTWIGAASRKRFRDVAIAASNRFGTTLRVPLVEALEPWAASVEQGPLLNRLAKGERIRDFNLARRMKPALKRVISVVR